MKGQKEIVVLLVLLAVAAGGVLLYVIHRRATRQTLPITAKTIGPLAPAPMVDLTKHDGQTIDFSAGRPKISESPDDRAALEQGLKDIEEARRGVIFEAEKSTPKKP